MNSLKLSVLLVLIGYICARPYAWPTNASRTITTVFGDARPRRFHAGMDIRTWGNTGYELYAVDNGYIQRIRTSSKGYGKAVYLKLQDGNTAVYAHLENFSKPLNIAVRKFQEASHSYTIDHYFLPEEFPIKKGEIIGYSGDTGTISGAHLHFEIRDENENPVNPQLLGIQIEDTIPPTFLNLAAIPQFPDSKVGKSPIPVIYPAHPVGNNEFIIEDTLYTTGSVGLAVQVEDKLNDQPFSYGIFSIELRIDGVLWYQRKYDSYSFREEYLSIWDLDYTLKQLTGDKYFRLFHEPGSEIQSFVKFWNPNPTKPEVGIHKYKITASDFSGNTAVITGMIKNLPSSIGMPM
ncbi:MAG: M23 family metallopeptidase, partial [Fidelibacterota bacterium]